MQRTSKLLFELFGSGSRTILIDPVRGLLECGFDSGLVITLEFSTKTVTVGNLALNAPKIVLKRVEGLNLLPLGFIFSGEFLSFTDHAFNFFFGQTALRVGDLDGLGVTAIKTSD